LIEESRKNYLENGDFVSSYGSGNSWLYGVGTDVFSASSGSQLSTNPDGSSPAYHYAPSSVAGLHRFYRSFTVDAYDTKYVVSVFAKRVTEGSTSGLNRYLEIECSGDFALNGPPTGHGGSHGMSSVTFDLQDVTAQYIGNSAVNANGLVGDPKIEDYGNGWYRCSYVFNPGTNDGSASLSGHIWFGHPNTMAADAGNETGNGNPSFYLWGAMIEKGSFLTSYIPNHGAYQLTRGADLLRIMDDEFKDIFGDEFKEFTIVADYDNSDIVDGSIGALVDFWGESSGYTDRIEIFKDTDSPYHIETRAISNNAGIFANHALTASSKAATQRFATSWTVDYDYATSGNAGRRWAFSFSGEAIDVVNDNVSTTVPPLTRLGLGNTPTRLDLSPGKLHFKRFTFYPKAVSDQQLINLSTP